MNIIFFGSSEFAVPSLRALLVTGHKISCVVTQPDKKKGRGLYFEGTAVKAVAEEFGIDLYQPRDVNTAEAIKFLKSLSADLFIVISYGQILSREILDIPKIFSINIHASVLPQYRGAAPMNWAIIKGEKTTGITIIKMTEKMDAGATIMQKITDITEDDTIITLEDKLSKMAAESLEDCLKRIENNNYKLISQDEDKVSLAPKLKKEDGLINWSKPAQEIHNLIIGVLNWPGAFTYYQGKLLKIYKTRLTRAPDDQTTRAPGQIIQVSKEGIEVGTGEGSLIIEELQIEGKRRMKVEEFIAGHKILLREILGTKK